MPTGKATRQYDAHCLHSTIELEMRCHCLHTIPTWVRAGKVSRPRMFSTTSSGSSSILVVVAAPPTSSMLQLFVLLVQYKSGFKLIRNSRRSIKIPEINKTKKLMKKKCSRDATGMISK
ncbi:hypothetical protein Mapa_010636 [Marchantia paleacea]|nr:hypothetical protein Mapa_010636 [Marchantia paleacea]